MLKRHPPPRRPSGMTLIEVLVAIVVLAVGVLAMAGLQAATARYGANSGARSASAALLADIAERIRINADSAGANFSQTAASTSLYLLDERWADQQREPAAPNLDCLAAACSAAQRAVYDMAVWRQQVRAALPQGAALVSGDRASGIQVTLMWLDREQTQQGLPVQSPTCGDTGTLSGLGQQGCCPNEAAAPAGVRCTGFSFIP